MNPLIKHFISTVIISASLTMTFIADASTPCLSNESCKDNRIFYGSPATPLSDNPWGYISEFKVAIHIPKDKTLEWNNASVESIRIPLHTQYKSSTIPLVLTVQIWVKELSINAEPIIMESLSFPLSSKDIRYYDELIDIAFDNPYAIKTGVECYVGYTISGYFGDEQARVYLWDATGILNSSDYMTENIMIYSSLDYLSSGNLSTTDECRWMPATFFPIHRQPYIRVTISNDPVSNNRSHNPQPSSAKPTN